MACALDLGFYAESARQVSNGATVAI